MIGSENEGYPSMHDGVHAFSGSRTQPK